MTNIINRIRNLKEKKEGARIIIIQSWRDENIDDIWNLSDQNIEDLVEFYQESLDRLHSEKLRRGGGGDI